jgi:hypothetical protein
MIFNIKIFYLIGAILMIFGVLGSLVNLFIIWEVSNIGVKISVISTGVLFNFLLTAFFFYMYKQTPDMTINNNELDNLLNQYGGKNGTIQEEKIR